MSPVISINTLCFPPAPLDDLVDAVGRIGAPGISPDLMHLEEFGVEAATRLLRDSGLAMPLLTHRAFGYDTPATAEAARERLKRTIDIAQGLGALSICMTTGGRGDLTWKEAARRFADAIAPCAEYSRQAGVPLAIEPTTHLYVDASLAHRLTDLVTLAKMAGISVGVDMFCCWMDSDFEEALAAAEPICAFYQLSDYVLGDRSIPCRAALGDGAAHIDRIVREALATGYRGPFDIEVIGPRLWDEGAEAGLKRSLVYLENAIQAGLAAAKAS